MIRDPSDGSVREKTSKEITLPTNEINDKSTKTGSKEITSGLPETSDKPEELARLERAREWIKNWHRKETT